MGIAMLLAGPLVAFTPVFTPPPNGCPPCPDFPNVTTPFTSSGIGVMIVGVALVIYGGAKRMKGDLGIEETYPRLRNETAAIALMGVLLLVLASTLSGIDLRGPGWSIVLYEGQGLYLGTLGVGMLLFAGFAALSMRRSSALFMTVGIILCGISLLFSYTLSSDFATRCFPEVGCSPVLANSTVSEMIQLGYLLAVGAFFLALGLSTWVIKRGNKPQEGTPA